MAKILILNTVNDDLQLEQSVALSGHIIETASSAEEAMWLIRCSLYDLVIADWRARDAAKQTLRYTQRQTHISSFMAISDSDAVCDKVEALDLGADDYLVMPFSGKELRAHVNALLRRAPLIKSSVATKAGFRLDTQTGRVFFNGKSQELSRRECALLETFLRRPEQILPTDMLLRLAWPSNETVAVDALRQNVCRLRVKMKNLTNADLIGSVYGIGYRASLECLSENGNEEESQTKEKIAG